MAKSSIKIRAGVKGGVTTVKALISHPMEFGGRTDKKTGKKVPAEFIETVTCTHAGNQVMEALWSGGVSKNPYLSFKFEGAAKGDEITVAWKDNTGKEDTASSKIR